MHNNKKKEDRQDHVSSCQPFIFKRMIKMMDNNEKENIEIIDIILTSEILFMIICNHIYESAQISFINKRNFFLLFHIYILSSRNS